METRKVIETNIDDLQFGYWDEKEEKFIPIISGDNAKLTMAMLIDSICFFVDKLRMSLQEDLMDIWKRLDKFERERMGNDI